MPTYDKRELSEKAKELNVVRDTFEKVCRLQEILWFIDSSDLLKNSFALKGGTAINLVLFDLPRLSVDIDLDFTGSCTLDEMIEQREDINRLLAKYMTAEGYTLSQKSKSRHSLDSFVYEYVNSAGIKDNIKIEPNYSLRSHILPIESRAVTSENFGKEYHVNMLSPVEIYATKTVALLTRGAARDLYDMNYMIKSGVISDGDYEIYRKCVMFYFAISTETPMLSYNTDEIDNITNHKIFTDLLPVIRDRDVFQLENAKQAVKGFLSEKVYYTDRDVDFLRRFKNGYYRPELLFDDIETVNRIENHPMALWKTAKNRDHEI